MPFIINNIDTAMTVIAITIRIAKFIATVLHYLALLIGAALIITGVGIIRLIRFIEGRNAVAQLPEVEPQPQPIARTKTKTRAKAKSATKAKAPTEPKAKEWDLEEAVAPITPAKGRTTRKAKPEPALV